MRMKWWDRECRQIIGFISRYVKCRYIYWSLPEHHWFCPRQISNNFFFLRSTIGMSHLLWSTRVLLVCTFPQSHDQFSRSKANKFHICGWSKRCFDSATLPNALLCNGNWVAQTEDAVQIAHVVVECCLLHLLPNVDTNQLRLAVGWQDVADSYRLTLYWCGSCW